MKEAMFYEALPTGTVLCQLCPHRCRVKEGRRGACGVRENRGGRLFSLVHSKVVAANIDPIEKKPLFHFYPGSLSFSVATVGCNMHCLHCQNSDISQMPCDRGKIVGRDMSPEQAVSMALEGNCRSISYTYTEPTVYFEYAYDPAQKAVQAGLKNAFVTNGYIEAGPMEAIQPWLHGANVDLKSFRDSFYRRVCKARLGPVLDALERMKALGIWLEVTTLLIPGMNDEEEELRDIARFLCGLGQDVPWHVSAFYPTYRMTDRSRTTVEALQRAWQIGKEEGLLFVYTGNVPGDEGEHTYCPQCGTCVIRRYGFRILSLQLDQGRCHQCKRQLPIRMDG
jgi:pyruvate formate lyase activating enzyme